LWRSSTPQEQRNEISIGYASKGRMCEARKVHVALSGVRASYKRKTKRGGSPPDQRNLPKGDLDCIATWRRE